MLWNEGNSQYHMMHFQCPLRGTSPGAGSTTPSFLWIWDYLRSPLQRGRVCGYCQDLGYFWGPGPYVAIELVRMLSYQLPDSQRRMELSHCQQMCCWDAAGEPWERGAQLQEVSESAGKGENNGLSTEQFYSVENSCGFDCGRRGEKTCLWGSQEKSGSGNW